MRKQAIQAERPKAKKREIEHVLGARELPYNQLWALAKTSSTNMAAYLRPLVAERFRDRIGELVAANDEVGLDMLRAACLVAGIDASFVATLKEVRKGGNGTGTQERHRGGVVRPSESGGPNPS